MNREKILIKISSPSEINFYEEHKKIIESYGYVDFAKIGKTSFNTVNFEDNSIIIIDNKAHNNQAMIANWEESSGNKIAPKYYKDLLIDKAKWLRFTSLELVSFEEICEKYITRTEKPIIAAIKSMAPIIYVHERGI